jgi:hypothetical protein
MKRLQNVRGIRLLYPKYTVPLSVAKFRPQPSFIYKIIT